MKITDILIKRTYLSNIFRSRTMSFRSGWVGVASRKNIIDFLYYSYLFNPTYVRVIEYHPNTSSDSNSNSNTNTNTNINTNNTSNKQ